MLCWMPFDPRDVRYAHPLPDGRELYGVKLEGISYDGWVSVPHEVRGRDDAAAWIVERLDVLERRLTTNVLLGRLYSPVLLD